MSNVILKIQDASRQTHRLNKLLGTVSLESLVDLLTEVNLEANPRLSKTGRVTEDIEESMTKQADIFHFMSKGILVAASEVEELERNRFRLKFDDPELEGILDGGHNSLAAGRFIIKSVVAALEDEEAADKAIKGIKTWAQLKEAWIKYLPTIKANKGAIPEILMPVEVIFPTDDPGGYEYFQEKVLTINGARNNNAELTAETRANKLGYYEEIKDNLDPAIVDQVEWKSNDGGRIKVRDLVALGLIPLSKLGRPATEQVRRAPTVIFSSKGQCVKIYDELMLEAGVTREVKGNIIEIIDPGVKSALVMMEDLPRLYDLIYDCMPDAYNKAGGKFGKIDGVSVGNFKTRYYRKACGYSYGEGFIYPLVYGLTALMEVKGDSITWITDPQKFLKQHLPGVMKSFYAMITGQQFDPAKVGKSAGAYNLACDLYAAAHQGDVLKALQARG
jgi:hypothetical protein